MSRHHATLNPRRWAVARNRARNRDGWRCRRCGRPGALEVHHVKPLDDGGDAYELDNLETICRACHIRHHERDRLLPGRAEWLDYLTQLT